MMLSAEFIKLFRKLGLIYIEPFNEAQLNPNSYDVRLGNWFVDVDWIKDEDTLWEPIFEEPVFYSDGFQVPIGNGYTTLGMTKERIGSRFCVVPEIRSKSSTRRCGITICDDAGFGDIGYYDQHWTVELEGHSYPHHPYLTVGERFAQVCFFLSTPTLRPYKGQYQSKDWPNNMIPKKYRRS